MRSSPATSRARPHHDFAWRICTAAPVFAADAADHYPAKPIKIVVPYPPGGTTDTLIRIVSARLQKAVDQPVVVEKKGGAAGTLGADFVAKSAPDGYTLLVGAAHHTIAQSVLPNVPYKFGTDFTPITMLAIVPNVVVVNASVPAKTVGELVALTKTHPDTYSYGSVGPGSVHHLIGEMFKLETGAKLAHIPYRGSAPAVSDLLGGQVAVMFDTVTSAMQHVRSGKTRALAVTTAKRSSALPDVPTLAETGLSGFDVGTWFGLMAPAGTPTSIIEKLNKQLVAILKDPAVCKQLLDQGIEPVSSTPLELKARIDKELTNFGELAKLAKLSAE